MVLHSELINKINKSKEDLAKTLTEIIDSAKVLSGAMGKSAKVLWQGANSSLSLIPIIRLKSVKPLPQLKFTQLMNNYV